MSHRLTIPLAAFLAVLPLLLHGPTCGHDFDFHLLSWLEAATQYAHGQYPHWAYTPAFNAGEPRFLFYPPISWTLGALLTLTLPIQYAATAFTFLALTASGFTAHRLAVALQKTPGAPSFPASSERVGCSPIPATNPGAPSFPASPERVGCSPIPATNPGAPSFPASPERMGYSPIPATNPGAPSFPASPERVGCSPIPATTPGAPCLASETWGVSTQPHTSSPPLNPTLCAILYLANPYMLFTAYERSAFAELLAAAFLPLLFQAALTQARTPRRQIAAIAIPLALIWLTNAPAAVMATYALALLTLTRLILATIKGRHSGRSWPESPYLPSPGTTPTPGAPSFGSLIAKGWGIVSARKRPLSVPSPTLRAPSIEPHPMGGSTLKSMAVATLAGTTLGLALPAFYLLPAAYERRYVQITLATITGMRPQDHFLFHRMPGTTLDDLFHNAVVQTASIVSLLLIAAIAALFLILKSQNRDLRPGAPSFPASSERVGCSPIPATTPGAPCLASETWGVSTPPQLSIPTTLLPLTTLILILLTPISLPLWTHTPQLSYLQFPWRLDALLAVILLTLLTQIRVPHVSLLRHGGLFLAAILILPAYTLFHQPCDATDTPTARAALFHSPLGTEPTDEYTPATADNDQLKPNNPPYRAVCTYAVPASDPGRDESLQPASGERPDPAPAHLSFNLPCSALVVLNRRQYPSWQITDQGRTLIPVPPTDAGLLTLNLPPGPHSIDLTWHRTPDQSLGLLLSTLALTTLLILVKPPKRLQPA